MSKKTLLDQDTKLAIIKNMETYGGSFVQALAQCIKKADFTNLLKLDNAFGEYIDQYHPDNWGKNETR